MKTSTTSTTSQNGLHTKQTANQLCSMYTIKSEKLTVAKMFERQIVLSLLDHRITNDVIIVSDFMVSYGNEIYKANKTIYAALYGFILQAQEYNKRLKLYKHDNTLLTFNPQNN